MIERILAIARYLQELCQQLYTRNRFDRETLAKFKKELDSARSAPQQERPDATPDDDCDEQLCEVIGELQDAKTDLEIERSLTFRLGVDLEAARRRAHDLAQDLTREKEHFIERPRRDGRLPTGDAFSGR